MKTYVCESKVNGIEIFHSFDCKTRQEAESIAKSGGWSLVAELIEEHHIESEVVH